MQLSDLTSLASVGAGVHIAGALSVYNSRALRALNNSLQRTGDHLNHLAPSSDVIESRGLVDKNKSKINNCFERLAPFYIAASVVIAISSVALLCYAAVYDDYWKPPIDNWIALSFSAILTAGVPITVLLVDSFLYIYYIESTKYGGLERALKEKDLATCLEVTDDKD